VADEHGSGRFRLRWSGPAQRVLRREPGSPARVLGGLGWKPAPVPVGWRETVRSRLLICAAIFAVWTGAIEARLLYLQVVQHGEMMARANRQQLRTIKLPAKRGEIIDRAGRVLAYSVDADTIAADPTDIDDPDGVARLCRGGQRGPGRARIHV
jgi:hypothetical protein